MPSAKSEAMALRTPVRSVDPPGGSGRTTGPCSRLGRRTVAWPGVVISPRWFWAHTSRSTAGRSPSARYLPHHGSVQPLGVAHEVELAELAVELPQPRIVAHPVGAQMDEPGLPHPAVVEGGRVARPAGELRIPVDPLHHIGDVEVVTVEEPGDALSVLGSPVGGA